MIAYLPVLLQAQPAVCQLCAQTPDEHYDGPVAQADPDSAAGTSQMHGMWVYSSISASVLDDIARVKLCRLTGHILTGQ